MEGNNESAQRIGRARLTMLWQGTLAHLSSGSLIGNVPDRRVAKIAIEDHVDHVLSVAKDSASSEAETADLLERMIGGEGAGLARFFETLSPMFRDILEAERARIVEAAQPHVPWAEEPVERAPDVEGDEAPVEAAPNVEGDEAPFEAGSSMPSDAAPVEPAPSSVSSDQAPAAEAPASSEPDPIVVRLVVPVGHVDEGSTARAEEVTSASSSESAEGSPAAPVVAPTSEVLGGSASAPVPDSREEMRAAFLGDVVAGLRNAKDAAERSNLLRRYVFGLARWGYELGEVEEPLVTAMAEAETRWLGSANTRAVAKDELAKTWAGFAVKAEPRAEG